MGHRKYDIIVAGAGHAGCEAAAASAKLGSSVLLITQNLQNMAQMSCNPSMGGIAKGQIVREIDALGGCSGVVSDKTTIQFRMLNRSKGPAMWSPRSQNDRILFSQEWRKMLEKNSNLDFWQDTVVKLLVERNKVYGVVTALGVSFECKALILANGTFLNGIIHIGEKQFSGGRIGEKAVTGLTSGLIELGFISGRMKTGTPARVDGRSLNFANMEEQPGDENPGTFSFLTKIKRVKQRSCFLTYTNPVVHEILKTGFDSSPLFTGRIKGRGPRYCPSIEDKIDRFHLRSRHQLFVEPEGWDTNEYYINGFSSSLPEEIQFKALRKVPGFENAKFFRPGYAIEYDYFPPYQLNLTLETKLVENLYFAGQINGTTGYEEAAAQGLVAGINAHRKLCKKPGFILKRSEAYIGVLIDDLVTKGIDEPYRMFTSRAEYRLLLRQDNADLRLTPIGEKIGLASVTRIKKTKEKNLKINKLIGFLKETSVEPEEINPLLEKKETSLISQRQKAASLLLRPQISLDELLQYSRIINDFVTMEKLSNKSIIEETEINLKYQSYIGKEQEIAEKLLKLENLSLDSEFDYKKIAALSTEAREKLSIIKPQTIGQASRISGVSPSDLSVLLIMLGK